MIKLNSYVLIIRGSDRFKFIDGLSTNKVEGDCTVFTTTNAKVIDMVDVIEMGDFWRLLAMNLSKMSWNICTKEF